MAAVAPPSYESVISGVIDSAKNGTAVPAAMAKLSAEEIAAINSAPIPAPLDDDIKKKLYDDVAKYIAKDEEALKRLEAAAVAAVASCKRNDDIFAELLTMLYRIDKDNNIQDDKFAPQLEALREQYRSVIKESRTLAADIAVYSENFDEEVVNICADKTLSTDRRLEAINRAIEEVVEHKARASKIVDDLNAADAAFNKLTVDFANWANTTSTKFDAEIEAANKELTGLADRLKTLRNVLIGFGVGAGVGLGVAIGGCWAGPFAPVCWVAGALLMIGFGVGLVTTGIQFAACQDEINKKKAELAALKEKKAAVETARTTLIETAAVDRVEFHTNIQSIVTVWNAALADAQEIKDWLHKGADDADLPNYMAIQLAHGVALYTKMAKYLSIYASGLTNFAPPKPAS
ncbi:uncharacterized protein B0I36DRAFT_367011 [Microdochium trichocladiopsis]|uniref:Uncharacterized protein n=1 Tax=Microdochium trichocladiopsis TaxID=1682393 RepID=A0A9P9BLQ2_9PEZI|nr:uncharacterized protein B0I36DRAFT_367011 [Microdochium trichocladiopsis]KAH7025119.1 hypothetical protein B0I36DRAFT_367011 [Microdochium trichocladiopsis]